VGDGTRGVWGVVPRGQHGRGHGEQLVAARVDPDVHQQAGPAGRVNLVPDVQGPRLLADAVVDRDAVAGVRRRVVVAGDVLCPHLEDLPVELGERGPPGAPRCAAEHQQRAAPPDAPGEHQEHRGPLQPELAEDDQGQDGEEAAQRRAADQRRGPRHVAVARLADDHAVPAAAERRPHAVAVGGGGERRHGVRCRAQGRGVRDPAVTADGEQRGARGRPGPAADQRQAEAEPRGQRLLAGPGQPGPPVQRPGRPQDDQVDESRGGEVEALLVPGQRHGREHRSRDPGRGQQHQRAGPDPAADQPAVAGVGAHLVGEPLAELVLAGLEAAVERGARHGSHPGGPEFEVGERPALIAGQAGVQRAGRGPAHDPARLGLAQSHPAPRREVEQGGGIAVAGQAPRQQAHHRGRLAAQGQRGRPGGGPPRPGGQRGEGEDGQPGSGRGPGGIGDHRGGPRRLSRACVVIRHLRAYRAAPAPDVTFLASSRGDQPPGPPASPEES
jgi:hypothetical protein